MNDAKENKGHWPSFLSYPVSGSPREYVAHHGSTVSTATDAKAKSVAVIGQHNHLDLRPVTLKLKKKAIVLAATAAAVEPASSALLS